MEDMSGPMSDTFLEIYLDYYYRKAKKLQTRARAVGISLDKLTVMARADGVEKVEFNISLLEEQNGK